MWNTNQIQDRGNIFCQKCFKIQPVNMSLKFSESPFISMDWEIQTSFILATAIDDDAGAVQIWRIQKQNTVQFCLIIFNNDVITLYSPIFFVAVFVKRLWKVSMYKNN